MKEKAPRGLSGNLMVFGEKESYGELEDPPVPQKPKWCEKHQPQWSDVCPVHGLRWRELHEKLQAYAVASVFYCPVLECDEFDYSVDNLNYCANVPREGTNDYVPFRIEMRLKILFHKLAQREGDGK